MLLETKQYQTSSINTFVKEFLEYDLFKEVFGISIDEWDYPISDKETTEIECFNCKLDIEIVMVIKS